MTNSVALGPGRACPVDYRYDARTLAAPATLAADSLWVAGGLYGNTCALERLEELYAQERGNTALVFNGDFHWFDIDDAAFAAIERGVSRHIATRGNVETELAQPQAGAGCGCAYPGWVDDEDVARSNRIVERLQTTVARVPGAAARLAALPMYRIAQVGDMRVAIVHGDADSLAGWAFSQETLSTRAGQDAAAAALGAAGVSVFASSHTCLPVLQAIEGVGAVVNNGAAGMPNFAGSRCGIATRISVEPGANALYRARIGPLYVEAVPIDYVSGAWLETFLAQWPEGSDAHASYYGRLVNGPRYCVDQAVRAESGRNYLAGAPP